MEKRMGGIGGREKVKESEREKLIERKNRDRKR